MLTAKPGVIDRARLALRVFNGGLPSHPWNMPQSKAASFVWPAWREGKPEWQIVDFQSYVNEGFNLNTLIYQAIMYKVRAISSAPMRAYQGDPDQPELLKPDHPLAQLAARPNIHQSGVELCQLSTVYLNIAGNVYLWLDRPKRGGTPISMRTLRPDRVFIIPEKGGVRGYLYVPEGKTATTDWGRADVVPILPEDMMHIKLPNPGDPLEGFGYGLSPMSPLAQSGDVDNSITHFLKLFFQNGAMPSTALSFDEPMDDTEIARVKERWQEIYGGYENWSDVLVVARGGKVQKLGMTFEEMGFGSIDERNEARITGPFGVPVILLNTRVGSLSNTYANYETARRAFWQDTFVPEIGLYDAEYGYYLRSEDGGFIQHDTSRVPALQEDKPKLVEAAYKLWTMGTPLNMACQALGLDVPEVPGGDVGYLSISVLPVSGGAPKPKPTMATAPEAEQDNEDEARKALAWKVVKGWSTEQKVALWQKVDRIATSWEKRFASAASEQFEADKRAVLSIIGDARIKALERKATIAWDDLQTDVKAYLETEGGDAWQEKFVPLIQGVVTDQGKHWATTLGLEFDARNLFAEDWFNEYKLAFAQPINATTLDSIGAMLQQAQTEGWSVPTMQKHLGTMFEQWMTGDLSKEDFEWYSQRMPPHRTEAIARTETMRSANAGSGALFEDWGIKDNEWLATQDDRTRDSHRAADGQVVKVGQPFSVGGSKMLYPGDASLGAPPSEFVDCRCTVLPVVAER